MKIKGLTLSQFEAVTAGISSATYNGNVIVHSDAHPYGKLTIARLAVRDSRGSGARRTWTGRRGPYACWHAYRDVLGACFWVNPEAVITTGMATYRGRDGFARDFPATGRVNVGSQMSPVTMPQLCDHGTMDWHGGPVDRTFSVARDVTTTRRVHGASWPAPFGGVREPRLTPEMEAARERDDGNQRASAVRDGGRAPSKDDSGQASAFDKLVGLPPLPYEEEHTHSWVGGMIHIDDEDVEAIARIREVRCETCDVVYSPRVHAA